MTDLSRAANTPGVTDFVYDDANDILYLSTLSGEVLRFNAVTGSFLSPIDVGVGLASIALSRDGSFLLVGENKLTVSNGEPYDHIDRISLSNLAITHLDFQVEWLEEGVTDIAIAANGEALISRGGTNGAPLSEFLASAPAVGNGVVSGISGIAGSSPLITSDHGRYVLVLENAYSPASQDLYDSATDKVVKVQNGVYGYRVGDISEGAGLVAEGVGTLLDIRDLQLGMVKSLTLPNSDFVAGVHFSADGTKLFVLDGTADQIEVLNTTSWAQIGTIQLSGFSSPIASVGSYNTAQMSVSNDGRFLFVGVDGVLESIDLSANPTATPARPAYQSGQVNGVLAAVFGGGATYPTSSTTTNVTSDYIVRANQHLVYDETHSPAFTLRYNPGSTSNLTIKGSVQLVTSTPNLIIRGVADDGSESSDLIRVMAGGSLHVEANGAGSEAHGSASTAAVQNDGQWSVSSAAYAYGASAGLFTNSGTFSVTGDRAAGVAGYYSAVFTNTGEFTVSGASAALGAMVSSVSNSGDVTVTSQNGVAVAFELTGSYYPSQPALFSNSGVITAKTALVVYSSSSPAQSPLVHLTNNGTINGEIDLGIGDPQNFAAGGGGPGSQVINTGAIHGAIHFDDGNIFYDGSSGSQTGGIFLGAGSDKVLLGNDGETVYGGSGYDQIVGGAGNDAIYGGPGETTFSYESATAGVTVNLGVSGPQNTGGAGTDTLVNVGDLVGSSFHDTLTGSGSNQTLEGGAGDDTLVAGAGNEILDGGSGNDTAVLGGQASDYTVTPTSYGYEATSAWGVYELYNIETIQFSGSPAPSSSGQTINGTAGPDLLAGGPGNDTINGDTGNDVLSGGPGQDVLNGGVGDDTLKGGPGDDTLNGGAGTDTASYADAPSGVTVNLQITGPQNTGGAGIDTLTGVESLVGSIYSDVLTAGPSGSTITGGGGDDFFVSGLGDDIFYGGPGNCTAVYSGPYSSYTISPYDFGFQVSGPDGTDILYGVGVLRFSDRQVAIGSFVSLTARPGGDILIGDSWADTLVSGPGNDTMDGKDGYDTAVFSGNFAAYTFTQSNGVVTVQGPDGTDSLTNIEALRFADQTVLASNLPSHSGLTLTGTSGNDTLTGGSGDDTISGLAGNDSLNGGAGNDTLNGGGGADTLDGGDGNDTLNGGAGNDTATYWDAASGVTVSLQLSGAQNTGGAGTDTLSGIENLTGSAFNDTLTAGATGSTLQGLAGNDVLVSGSGNDTLDGGIGNDIAAFSGAYASYTVSPTSVSGPQGTDTLASIEVLRFSDRQMVVGSGGATMFARAGGDLLFGGPGDDVVSSASGANIQAGAGDDQIFSVWTNDVLDGGPGTDTLVVLSSFRNPHSFTQNGSTTVLQENGAIHYLTNIEIVMFTDGQEVISSSGQTVTARSGGETLLGGVGADTLIGSSANDTLYGNAGNDVLNGGAGTDLAEYSGAMSAYTINTTGGTTTVSGPDGTDTLTNIELLQFDNGEMVLGSAGEFLTARRAGDILIGGAGDDTLITWTGGNDTIDGGAGNDTVSFSGTYASYTVGLSGGVVTVSGGGGTYTLTNVESLHFSDQTVLVSSLGGGGGLNLNGTANNDTMTGGSGDDTIHGRGGDDVVNGLGGNDTLYGDAGNDTLDGGAGNDTLVGGTGVNTATYVDAASGVTVNLQLSTAQNTGGAGTDTLTQIQNLTGSNFNDTLTAATTGSVLQGLGGDDVLVSGAGNDTLDGGTGNDTAVFSGAYASYTVTPTTVSGPQGTDTLANVEILRFSDRQMVIASTAETLTARAGGDSLYGGSGDDTLVTGTGNDTIDGAGGNDTVNFSGTYASYTVGLSSGVVTVSGGGSTYTLTNVESLHFSDQTVLVSSLGSGGVTLNGTSGNDTLTGGAGNDTLNGLDGSDTLIGLGGNDTLSGGNGPDILNGGTGQDTLSGNSGNDTFVFTALADSTVATPDLITDFTSGKDHIDVSAIDPSFQIGTSPAAHTIVVTYDAVHDRTVVDLYVTSSLGAEIWLSGNHPLTATDFVL